MIRKVLLAASAAVALSAPALAADFRDPYAYKAPPRVYQSIPVHNWTGLYVGAHGGGAFGGELVDQTNFTGSTFTDRYDMSGWTAGGLVGYNLQLGNFLVGLETEYNWSNVSGSKGYDWCDVATCGFVGTDTTTHTLRHWGSTRARLGYAWNKLMIYGTGGVAYGGVDTEYKTSSPFGTSTATQTGYGLGYAVGAGAEWAFAQNWSAKVEYLYLDLDLQRMSTNFGFHGSRDFSTHLVRGGVNYRF